MVPAFQRTYPLPVGPYAWIPPVFGVGTLLVLSFLVPFLLLVLPFALGLSLLPRFIMGGRLHVVAQPGFVRLTRSRLSWNIVRELSFPPNEMPRVQATRPYSHKPFGILRVDASTGYREVPNALYDALTAVAVDLHAYYRGAR